MSFETERNAHRAWRLPANASLLQGGVMLLAFGILVAAAIWPLTGSVLAIVIAVLAAATVVGLALRIPPWAAMRLYGGRPHDPAALQQAEGLIAELSARAGLRRSPRLYVIPSTLLSAFSVGSAQASAIAVTEGLLRRLTLREIAAVLAREVSLIAFGDLLAFGIADIVTRIAQALYYVGLALAALNLFRLISGEDLVSWLTVALFVLAPALLNLLQLRLPRARDFQVDRGAALMTGDALGLASAISRLETPAGSLKDDLLPPVPARKVPLPSLLRYPAATERRIAQLRTLDPPPMPPIDIEEGPRISLVGVGPIAMRPRFRWQGVWF
jgi:heat shock protein HtpX